MRISRKAFAFVLGAVLAFAVTEQAAKADIIYTYTGQPFSYVGYAGTGPDVTNVSGFFTLSSSLAPDTTYDLLPDTVSGGTVIDYDFTDGITVWDLDNYVDSIGPVGPTGEGGNSEFSVTTDASGEIVDWTLNIFNSDGVITTCTSCIPDWVDGSAGDDTNIFSNYDAYNNSDPGTWTESGTTATPEPASVLLLFAGLLGLGIMALWSGPTSIRLRAASTSNLKARFRILATLLRPLREPTLWLSPNRNRNRSKTAMRISRKAFAFVLGVALAFAVTEQAAKADVIYTYTGNDFTSVYPGEYSGHGPYSGSDFVSASFTFASPLPDDLALGVVDEAPLLLSFSITDQLITVDSVAAFDENDGPTFQTDGTGDIVAWSIVADYPVLNGGGNFYTSNIPSQEIDTGDGTEVNVGAGTVNLGHNNQDPGTWTETSTSSTPEPSTTVLVSLGGSFLLIAMKRKRCNRTKKLSSMGAIVRCK